MKNNSEILKTVYIELGLVGFTKLYINSLFPNDALMGSVIVFRIPNDTLMCNVKTLLLSREPHSWGQ